MTQIKITFKRFLFSLTFVSCIATLAVAQEAVNKLPVDPNLIIGKFPNGLTYYIRSNKKPENKVELRLVVNAGSILEENDQQGLAHFMEHMNFNGTKNFEKNDLVSYLQSIGVQFGADLNAYTSFDQTVYILPIPTDKKGNLEKGFQILEDWAHDALLTDRDIDDERGVVLEESRLGKGADDRMFRKYFPKLTDGSKYAERLPIGKDDILKKFSYERIRDFYHQWYRPDLQAVIVVGDIDTATAKKMITDHFAGLKNPSPETRRKYETIKPRKEPMTMVCKDKEAMNTMMMLSFPYTKKHENATTTDYKSEIIKNLGITIINHRLNDIVQSASPPFPFAAANFDDMIHGFESLSFYCGFSKTGPDSAIYAIAAEILKLKKFGINQTELDLAKRELLSGMEKSYNERKTTESKNYAEECIRNFLDKEPIPGIENEYGYYKTFLPDIQVANLNNVIKSWVSSKNFFTLITGPDRIEVELPKESELIKLVEDAFAQTVTKSEEKKVAASLMNQKPAPGRTVSQVKEDGFDATTYTLSNAIKVTIKTTDFKSDEILLTGTKRGGINNYDLEDRSNIHFATDVVEAMGLGDFTPSDLEKAIAGKNIKVNLSVNDISDIVKANSSVKDIETMLQLLNLYLTKPRRDEALYKAYKDKMKMQVEFLTANPRVAFFDTTIKMLYENNPLARMVFPKVSDIEKTNMDRALEIYRNEFATADGYHFFLVGNVKPEVVLPLLETYLGSIPGSNRTPKIKDNGVRPISGNHEYIFNKGKEKQSIIFGAYTGQIPYSEEFAMTVHALSDILNIKVIEDLREKMGGIYAGGFNGSVVKEPYERFGVMLQLPCGPENVQKLLVAANHEIDTLKEAGPSETDLNKVKNQWKEKQITNVKENKYWCEKMESVLFWGKDKSRVLDYEKYVDKITPADIQDAAKKVFNGNNQFISVLNPE